MVQIIVGQDFNFEPQFMGVISVENGKKVMKQCSRSTPVRAKGFFIPTKKEISNLLQNFKKVLSMKSEDCCVIGGSINELDDYGYQLIGVRIKKEKFIYLNAYSVNIIKEENKESFSQWIQYPIVYCDGYDSFWGVLFNIETGEFNKLAINGR